MQEVEATLVMKESIGSTVSLVTLMMNASHVALSSFSSSFLLSTCHPQPPLTACPCLLHILAAKPKASKSYQASQKPEAKGMAESKGKQRRR